MIVEILLDIFFRLVSAFVGGIFNFFTIDFTFPDITVLLSPISFLIYFVDLSAVQNCINIIVIAVTAYGIYSVISFVLSKIPLPIDG